MEFEGIFDRKFGRNAAELEISTRILICLCIPIDQLPVRTPNPRLVPEGTPTTIDKLGPFPDKVTEVGPKWAENPLVARFVEYTPGQQVMA